MQYFGGKSRIAKKLGAELQSRLKPNQTFVDLFCGSCNIVSNVNAEIRIANDIHPQLMAMHRAVQNGWIPPEVVTEEDYRLAKTMLKALLGLVVVLVVDTSRVMLGQFRLSVTLL